MGAIKASGRAKCRWCGEIIEKGMPAIWLTIGSYGSKGYIHSLPEHCHNRIPEGE